MAKINGIEPTYIARSSNTIRMHVMNMSFAYNSQIHVMYQKRMFRKVITFEQRRWDPMQLTQQFLQKANNCNIEWKKNMYKLLTTCFLLRESISYGGWTKMSLTLSNDSTLGWKPLPNIPSMCCSSWWLSCFFASFSFDCRILKTDLLFCSRLCNIACWNSARCCSVQKCEHRNSCGYAKLNGKLIKYDSVLFFKYIYINGIAT